jgi:thiol-disulfide isomerase/thioredoxin
MKKLAVILIVCLVACSGPVNKGFIIKGTLSGNAPEKIYLEKYIDKKWVVQDSADIVNGQFELTGKLVFPEYLSIQLGKDGAMIGVFAENSKIIVTANADSLELAKIEGSCVHDQMVAFNGTKKEIELKSDSIYQLFKASTIPAEKSKLESQLDSLDLVMTDMDKNYVKEHPASVLSPFLVTRGLIYSLELDELEKLVGILSPEIKESDYVRTLEKRIEILRTLEPGLPAPLFSQADTSGNMVSLESFKGKYLFIDFWASWCGPCRRANPTVVEMYKKYSNKNFTILGVSMDKDQAKWIEAIHHDDLLWIQVSTLQGWDNPVALLYGVNSIPHGILIDPEGKIVKRSIHASELDNLLAELLK